MRSTASPLSWLQNPTKTVNKEAVELARRRQSQLTKPPGSLGRLEALALQFAGWQGHALPQLTRICVRIFAADHGVCAQNVSAFPQVVTTQMIANFLAGGAAISVLSRSLGADLAIYDLGTAYPVAPLPGLHSCAIAPGTQDFTQEPAMSEQALVKALAVGASAVPEVPPQLFIGGEMGIGNTTSASALFSALLKAPVEITVGPGTGVDEQGMSRKRDAITHALTLHGQALRAAAEESEAALALTALRSLGGFEVVALVGAYIACAQRGIPALVDGFISTAAALCAVKINPGSAEWLLFSHRSAEPAHQLALECLGAVPLLDLQMRLGEGSGAAVAVPLLQAALKLHCGMATFDDAGVCDGQTG